MLWNLIGKLESNQQIKPGICYVYLEVEGVFADFSQPVERRSYNKHDDNTITERTKLCGYPRVMVCA